MATTAKTVEESQKASKSAASPPTIIEGTALQNLLLSSKDVLQKLIEAQTSGNLTVEQQQTLTTLLQAVQNNQQVTNDIKSPVPMSAYQRHEEDSVPAPAQP